MMKVLATTLFMMVLLEPSFAAPGLRRRTTENVESGFANFVASATNNDWMEDSNSTLVVETDSNNTLVEESANSTLIISEEGADDMMEDIDVEEEIPAEEEEEEVVVAQPEAPEQAEPESEEVAQPEVAQPEAQPEWEGGEGAQFEDGEGGEEGEEGGNWAKVTRGDCGCQGHCSVCQQFFALCVELYCFS